MRRLGSVALTLALVLLPAASALPVLGTKTCQGEAPESTECSVGGGTAILVRLSIHLVDFGYTGTVVNRVTHDLGALEQRCVFTKTSSEYRVECDESGSPLLPGTRYEHACRSLNTASGHPGGSGAWKCGVTNGV